MRRCFAVIMALLLLGAWAGTRAGETDDQYIGIYQIIREADAFNEAGQLTQALAKYTEARGALLAFHKANPDWNIVAVNYRLDYLGGRITAIAARAPAVKPANAAPESAPQRGGASPALPAGPRAPADWANQLDSLKGQTRQLSGEKQQLQMEKEQWLAERGLLEAKLKEALTIQPAAADPRELAKAEQRIKDLEKEKDLLSVSLEQAKKAKAPAPVDSPAAAKPASPSAEAGRLKEVERQRDELAKKLEAANKALAGRKGKASKAQVQAEIDDLRAKLEALEARKAPYSPEELALFRPSEPVPASPSATRKSVREVPAGLAALAGRARSFFYSKQYEKAEELYVQILREDEKNVGALSDLAFIELKLNRVDKAEKYLKGALEAAPDDPYSLMILGRLRVSQKRYDDAFQALSRAAQGDPQNAEVQNDLGIVLSEKGQRGPAEAAFRKAILLRPDYGDAHSNLAVFYLSQQPPLVELARWHYQKALAANLPHNPEIERMLEAKKAASR